MRRGYSLQDNDKEILIPIMEGIIWRLEAGDIDNIELSVINLGPSQFMYLLECLGYERLQDWDTSSWRKILGIIIRKKDILHLLYTIADMMEKLHYL